MPMEEVRYIMGDPNDVYQPSSPIEFESGVELGPTLTPFTSDLDNKIKNYRGWWYIYNENAILRIEFNKLNGTVISIICEPDAPSSIPRCPPIANIQDGGTEEDVINRFGRPSYESVKNLKKKDQI
jgi:hypothetical protein